MTSTLAAANRVQTVGKTTLFLADADPTTAGEIVSTVDDFYRDFPLVAQCLGDVKLGAQDEGSYAFTTPANRYRAIPPFHVTLNPLYYGAGTRVELELDVAQDFAAGFHRYPNPSGVFEHELGHCIDFYLANGGSQPPSLTAPIDWDDAASVSGYGLMSGPPEVFADAFALWRAGLNPGNTNIRTLLRGWVNAAGGRYA